MSVAERGCINGNSLAVLAIAWQPGSLLVDLKLEIGLSAKSEAFKSERGVSWSPVAVRYRIRLVWSLVQSWPTQMSYRPHRAKPKFFSESAADTTCSLINKTEYHLLGVTLGHRLSKP